MKYAEFIKFSQECSHEKLIADSLKIKGDKSYYYKGLLYRPIHNIIVGYNADDFIRNLFTVALESFVHKVPSIFKRIYSCKKKLRTRGLKRIRNENRRPH